MGTHNETAIHLTKELCSKDSYLTPFKSSIERRFRNILDKESQLTKHTENLEDFASGDTYFGLHYVQNTWIFREWAPNATAVYLIGDFSAWEMKEDFALTKINENGVWEISLPGEILAHGNLYRLKVIWKDGEGDRIPSYATRVVQDRHTHIFNAQVWQPVEYKWKNLTAIEVPETLLIYEAHIGMAQEEEKVGTFVEFQEKILPRVVKAGYNALQIMAIQEHPYYASFGYHISSYFAVSSRFGTPEDLKALVDAAHESGLLVIMDIVHSHAVNNEIEGLSRFDGSLYQYFHEGARGKHIAWDSRCFDYNKNQVLHFLLSNCKYFLEVYKFDGFRFDGITSMIYHHHGLEKAFTSYDDYFDDHVDEDALTYLALANKLIHAVKPSAITIAEDISGMPGIAAPFKEGGFGFDYRLAMGIPDYWIKLTKEYTDENWPIGDIWYELNNRRNNEKTISYCESHDQALVGDKTLFFRLAGAEIYEHMSADDNSLIIDRAMSLHKMIRLITIATAGNGYMNFMGNEFGHPEWIDFPREGNGWSYFHARRQWHLCDASYLKYQYLLNFDRDMIELMKNASIFKDPWPYHLYHHSDDKVLAFCRKSMVFVFNFNPTQSYTDYHIEAPAGKYQIVLNSDSKDYGGHARLTEGQAHFTLHKKDKTNQKNYLSLYIPSRTAIVLKPSRIEEENGCFKSD